MLRAIRRALLSVTDKTGLVELARELQRTYGVELWGSGGTRRHLEQAGIAIRDLASLTGFPEILDGRVKTLHPAVYAGLLARRDKPEHLAELTRHQLPTIDLVVCNLYPFEAVSSRAGVTEEEVIENIDIGGPCLIRAAAKNFDGVAVLVEPSQYEQFLKILAEHGGQTPREYRRQLAAQAFARIREYDAAIAAWFGGGELTRQPSEAAKPQEAERPAAKAAPDKAAPDKAAPVEDVLFPETFTWHGRLVQRLRYGENPHQQAALYRGMKGEGATVAAAEQLHGKELSYNNWLDVDAAWGAVQEFAEPACVIVKHNNPCGAAVAARLELAFRRAWAGDALSAFGGIIACNRTVDVATASAITEPSARRFVECLIAPDYDADALEMLRRWKEHIRLLRLRASRPRAERASGSIAAQALALRSIDGGLLVQTVDDIQEESDSWRVVTRRPPTEAERAALAFAWRVCKHVKSNAIVLARDGEGGGWEVVGVGAGQMSRVDAVHIAVRKAGERAAGAVLASDAFFPFADNVEAAAAAGVTAIVQPGGSLRDADSIAAADRHGLAMLLTGVRHFRH
jgi:phosphoribosylaminoimidazolecarboxamide formyltransferase/IMP cyclohydrolase